MATVAMVATHWTPSFENMRRSLHTNGYEYEILGWGQKWSGFLWRVQLYVQFLSTQTPESFVIFTDAYDCLATRHSEDLASTFTAFGRPMIVGAEWYCGSKKNCGAVPQWWKLNKRKKSFRCNINAGFVAGSAGVLLEAYQWILQSGHTDDQRALAEWIEQFGSDLVALDTGSAIVYNAHILDGMSLNRTSFFQHFPGPMLKLGLFPKYNSTVALYLGAYGRKVYPSPLVEAAIWCFVLIATMLWILRPSKRIA